MFKLPSEDSGGCKFYLPRVRLGLPRKLKCIVGEWGDGSGWKRLEKSKKGLSGNHILHMKKIAWLQRKQTEEGPVSALWEQTCFSLGDGPTQGQPMGNCE